MLVFLGIIVVGYVIPVIWAVKQKDMKVARIWMIISSVVIIILAGTGFFTKSEINAAGVVSFVTGREVAGEVFAGESKLVNESKNDYPFAVNLGNDISYTEIYSEIKPAGCDTDTYLVSGAGVNYTGDLMLDGNLNTSWQDGNSNGSAIGEHITFYFDNETEIHYIVIRNGNCKSQEKYNQNSRICEMTVEDNKGNAARVALDDVFDAQVIMLNNCKKAKQITITIDSEYEGTVYKDTCISEVSFY